MRFGIIEFLSFCKLEWNREYQINVAFNRGGRFPDKKGQIDGATVELYVAQ